MADIGKIQLVEITQELQKSYLDYAMSVIVARALPDVRDGLKPVHRRILYAMKDMGLVHSSAYKKAARIVGEVLGKYHPHGDMAVYDALVRLAQDFSMRYPLIDGQGNFGSVDGDSPAAMRYTEARLAAISNELLLDLDKDTVDFIPNFDGSQQEPLVLPAKLPNLLLAGSDGIAVGMATKIPPHNLSEVVQAIQAMIKKGKALSVTDPGSVTSGRSRKNSESTTKVEEIDPKQLVGQFQSAVTTEELLEFIKGPDFPTGGAIYNWGQIVQTYKTGRGKITVRAITKIEETKSGKFRILVHELPYQVNKANLIAKIAQLVKDKKIKGIADLRDESDRRGMQVVIELKKDARPKAILNNLFLHTQLQTTFPANMVALVDGTPQLLSLKTILEEYIKHRQLVVVRRSQFELKAARLRAHILEGLMIALKNLDAVIQTIKKSPDADQAKLNLMKKFKLSEIQATAILDMQLRRLAALERQKIEDEYKMIQETIEYLTDLLTHPSKILTVIDKELADLTKKYSDERRTRVFKHALEEFSDEDLIPKKDCLITLTKTGYIKRLDPSTYRVQRRGGKGVMGMTTKQEDEIVNLLTATTHDYIFFFTNLGKIYKLKVYELPEGGRLAKGQAIINLINISQEEKVQSILTLSNEQLADKNKYIMLFTKRGEVKKTSLQDFANIRTSGIIAIRLEPDDRLIRAELTSGKDEVMIVSHDGKGIHFTEDNVRPMGRPAKGVRGIMLKTDDWVVTAEAISKEEGVREKGKRVFKDILIITERGFGKRTPITDFPLQKRGGIGVKVAKINPKVGKIVCAQLVNQEINQVVLTSKHAQVIKLPLRNIKRLGRNTQGVIVMRFTDKTDIVAAVTCLKK
jgi:DNA gyrase subunit A